MSQRRHRIPFSPSSSSATSSAKAAFDLLHSRAAGISSSSSNSIADDRDPLRLQSRGGPSLNIMNTEFFALPGLHPADSPELVDDTRDSRQMCLDSWGSTSCVEENANYVTNRSTTEGDVDHSYGAVLSRNSWMIPMLALASVNVCVIVAFEVYVVCKASRNTPSRRHLFLGQMLLLGLLIGSLVGFAYAVEPTELSCAVIRLGTGMAYTLIYSSILVKLVFLISLNTGVYLPATYQALLFLFCVLVQVAIGIQWVATSGPLCEYNTRDHILSLLYVIFLFMFSTSLAVKSRHYRDNYREAKYIGVLMAVSIPIWLSWIMAAIVLNESFHPACVGFGLLVCCAITFIVMFVPKSRQLSAIGKEGIYIEDQEDRFSLHSDRYSPSFYHFKPNKTVLQHPHHHTGHHAGSIYKEAIPDSTYYRGAAAAAAGGNNNASGNSYTGFHRPLRVVPPSATPSQHTPSPAHASAAAAAAMAAASLHHPPPPPYTSRTNYFPSHFFPEKMYHYWQYYYPRRLAGVPGGLAGMHGQGGGSGEIPRFYDSRYYERY